MPRKLSRRLQRKSLRAFLSGVVSQGRVEGRGFYRTYDLSMCSYCSAVNGIMSVVFSLIWYSDY